MKILMIVHGYAPECSGGTESYVRRLAAELRGLRHDVEIVCGSHEGRPNVEIETSRVDGIRVHRLRRDALYVDDWDKSYAPEIEPALDTVLTAFKPDLVHVHHWIRLSRHLIEIAHDRGVPAVCTLHDFWTTCPRAFRIRQGAFCTLPNGAASCHDCAKHGAEADDAENAEGLDLFREDFRNELRLARRVLFPSRAHKDAVLFHAPEIGGKARVEPFAPIGDLSARPEARRPDPKGRLRVRHWGHLSNIKGVDLLLQAAASLPANLRSRLDLKLMGVIVYPEERGPLTRLAAAAGATITDAPFTHDDLRAEPADLAVFPSRAAETHSFVVDEAFQLGLPVIAPDRGAPAERIGGGGAVFRADDAKALADVLRSALERPQLVERWKASIPAPRSFATHAAAVADVYREVVGSSAPLATTPLALRARRERFRSRQVEARTRRLDVLRGEVANLVEDVRKASATMAEMDAGHREKDKAIEHFRARAETSENSLAERIVEVAALRLENSESKRASSLELEDARTKARLAAEEFARRSARLEADAAALAARAAAAEAAKASTAAALEATRVELAGAGARIDVLSADNAALDGRLRSALAALSGREGAYAEAATEARRLAAELVSSNERLSLTSAALGRAEAEIARLKTEAAAATEALSARSAEIVSLRAGLATIESSLVEQSTRAESAEAKLREAEQDLAEHAELLAEYEGALEEHVGRSTDIQVALDELREARAGDRERDRAKELATLKRIEAMRAVFGGGEPTGGPEPHESEAKVVVGALRQIEAEAAEAFLAASRERTRLLDAIAERDAATTELCRAVDALERRVEALSAAAEASRAPNETIETATGVVERVKRAVFGDDRRPSVPKPLKVLMVLHQFLPKHVGGTEVYTYGLATALRALGHTTTVLTCEAHHDKAPFRRLRRTFDGVSVHEVVQNYSWDSFEATYDCPAMEAVFENVLDEEKPDVVHVQHLHYFSAGFLRIAARRGIPIVYTLHDYLILCPRDGQMRREDGETCREALPEKCADCIAHHRLDPTHVAARRREDDALVGMSETTHGALARVRAGLRPFDDAAAQTDDRARYVAAASERLDAWRDALKYVDVFVSPSNFLKGIFAASGLIPPEKIVVSDNGQDLARFVGAPPRVRGPRLRVGYVGTIAEHKGIHVLVEAMNRFADDDRVECSIYGHLEAFEDYRARLLALNKNPRTTFKGVFDPKDVGRVFSAFDVLVVPSLWWENSPLTIHEAAASRLPVIVSDQGGLAEYVVEGRNGLRFYMGDAEDLRGKIAWLLEDRARLDGFVFDAFENVSMATDARRTEARYRDLIAARAST